MLRQQRPLTQLPCAQDDVACGLASRPTGDGTSLITRIADYAVTRKEAFDQTVLNSPWLLGLITMLIGLAMWAFVVATQSLRRKLS